MGSNIKALTGYNELELISHFPRWAALGILAVYPAAYVLISTPKYSYLRFAWLAYFLPVAYTFCNELITMCVATAMRGMVGGMTLLTMNHILVVVLLRQLDHKDLVNIKAIKETDSWTTKLFSTAAFLSSPRALGTTLQARGVPSHPASVTKTRDNDGRIDKTWWITRNLLVIAWQYGFLNAVEYLSLTSNEEETMAMIGTNMEWYPWRSTPEQWIFRLLVGAGLFMGPARVALDLPYRVWALLWVLTGLSEPSAWLPVFGRAADIYTLRTAWGKFWHQIVRVPLEGQANFISRSLLRNKPKSTPDVYVRLLCMFALSGLWHIFIELLDSANIMHPTEQYGVFVTFGLSGIAMLLEDNVQKFWKYLTGVPPRKAGDEVKPNVWQRMVGYVWVAFFVTLVGPFISFPSSRAPAYTKLFVPYDVIEYVGIEAMTLFLVVGGPLIAYIVGAEI